MGRTTPKLTMVTLFSGLGGWDLGAQHAGLSPVLGVELDSYPTALYRRNFPQSRLLQADARRLTGAQLLHAAGGRIDVLHASPPCQPYSSAGYRRGAEDPRDLVPTWLRLVADMGVAGPGCPDSLPTWLTMENVPGLADWDHGAQLRMITSRLASLGYEVQHRILDAVDFGIPQHRRRLILVAGPPRAMALFRWPAPTHADPARFTGPRLPGLLPHPDLKPWVSAWDAIGDLLITRLYAQFGDEADWPVTAGDLARDGRLLLERNLAQGGHGAGSPLTEPSCAVLSVQPPALVYRPHAPTRPAPKHLRPWHIVPQHQARLVLADLPPAPAKRAAKSMPTYTLADRAVYGRRLTARECARLQGFPDDFDLAAVSEHRAKIAIGNAVPPALARAIVSAVAEADETARSLAPSLADDASIAL